MHWLRAVLHHPSQQLDKQRRVKAAVIGAIPEGAFRIHRRRGADRLPLARAFDHRCLALHTPGLAMHGVRPKAAYKHAQEREFDVIPETWGLLTDAFNITRPVTLGVAFSPDLDHMNAAQFEDFLTKIP